jgi:hypothetical protein
MSSEIIVAILSSLTTACVVLFKFYLSKKRENQLSQDILDIIKLHDIKSIKINIKENNGDFNFKSEGSVAVESFIPLKGFGLQIISSEKILPENEKLIIKYMKNKTREPLDYV